MPVDIFIGSEKIRIQATDQWGEINASGTTAIKIEQNYYVGSMQMR